ncbi:MAG: aspartyl/glutamyl-tRNA(Asn/Gln) amidotransferase subunit B [Candidatus Hydrogenedentota bacterium]
MHYEAVIGMEVHVQLATESKMFCSSSTNFHAAPNTNISPVSLGLPGTLPVINKKAVEYAIAVGLALNCTISRWSKMDRKNYFYPDLAKNYQISQYDLPLCHDGYLEIEVDGKTKRIGIRRAHIEEDTASNTHTLGGGVSGIDFNRCGIPLLEIVTEPDISSADEAYAYLTSLKQILGYLGVSDCNMEEGSLRAEANISIRPMGATEFGTKTEVKNVASFSGTHKAIDFEIARQQQVLSEGGTIVQETRGWDADKGITFSQRAKESAHDYRYFPDPDLAPIVVDEAWEQRIRESLPELPKARKARFESSYGLSGYDAGVLTGSRGMADFFETMVQCGAPAKAASNWLTVELQGILAASKTALPDSPVTPERLAGMILLIEDGTISGKMAKEILPEMYSSGKDAKSLVLEKGLVQISDHGAIEAAVREVIEANPGPVSDFRSGKERAFGFLVGQLMKATQGKVNPKLANEILRSELSKGGS